MSKLNKLVTNYPVTLSEEEVENLSATLAPVVAACGGGGGGGTPIYYYGDDVNINISPSRVIRLTDAATAKLNREVPTKVSDLTDSANYQTVAGMAEYLTELEAQSTYLTKSSADTLYAPLSTTADVEALKAASGNFSEYYKKYETSSKTELETEFAKYATTGEVDAIETNLETLSSTVTGNYATTRYVQDAVYDLPTKADLNKKQNKLVYDYDETGAISSIDGTPLAGQGGTTYSAGQYINIDANDTISVTGLLALDEYAQYEPVLIGDANITATSSKEGTHTQWNLSINSTPVVTDTKLTGQNCITAHTTDVSGEWAVGLVQSAYEAIDSIGGIATDVGTLKTASGDWNKVSDKLDTTAFSTVSGTFLTTIPDTYATKEYANNASANALSEAKTWVGQQGFYTKASGDNDYAPISITATVNTLTGASAGWNEVTAKLDKSIYANASGNWEASYNVLTAYSAAGTWLTAHQSLTNYYTKSDTSSKDELSTEFAKYQPTGYYATTAQLNTASSTLTGVDNLLSGHIDYVSGQVDNKLNVPLSSDISIQDKYLVLRTNTNGTVSGWCDFQDQSYSKSEANGTFVATANIDTTTLSGDGKSVSTKLGVKTDVIATKDYVNSSFLQLSGGTVSGQLEVHGGSNFDTQFIKLTREGNSCGARIGLGNDTTNGTLALKTFNSQGQNTVQVNIKHNTNNNELIQVQKGGSDIGFLIPAVTATTTAGLTNDGILHIILES